jgi:hypothetical protein
MRMGTLSPFRNVFRKAVREAAKYAVRASTACGTDNDFDPDAILNNMVVGLMGYNTQDGLSGDALDAALKPPRLFAPQLTLPRPSVKETALACVFVEKDQGDGSVDLHPYVYEFANAIAYLAVSQFLGELGTAEYLHDIPLPSDDSAALATVPPAQDSPE